MSQTSGFWPSKIVRTVSAMMIRAFAWHEILGSILSITIIIIMMIMIILIDNFYMLRISSSAFTRNVC